MSWAQYGRTTENITNVHGRSYANSGNLLLGSKQRAQVRQQLKKEEFVGISVSKVWVRVVYLAGRTHKTSGNIQKRNVGIEKGCRFTKSLKIGIFLINSGCIDGKLADEQKKFGGATNQIKK